MADRQTPIPDGYTHVELPKPQVRGWGELWATLKEALDGPEKANRRPGYRHQVKGADPTGWECVDCGQWFPTWPRDVEECPGPEDS